VRRYFICEFSGNEEIQRPSEEAGASGQRAKEKGSPEVHNWLHASCGGQYYGCYKLCKTIVLYSYLKIYFNVIKSYARLIQYKIRYNYASRYLLTWSNRQMLGLNRTMLVFLLYSTVKTIIKYLLCIVTYRYQFCISWILIRPMYAVITISA